MTSKLICQFFTMIPATRYHINDMVVCEPWRYDAQHTILVLLVYCPLINMWMHIQYSFYSKFV